MLKVIILFIILILNAYSASAQHELNKEIVFKDTVLNLAFDSLKHDLGKINPDKVGKYLVKHFKYIGTEPLKIVRAWTGDPHYICDYPEEELIPNKVYTYTICFSHKGKAGKMHKQMGFDLSNGKRVFMLIKGEYILQKP